VNDEEMRNISLNKPFIDDKEIEAVLSVLKSRSLSGNGVIGKETEDLMSRLFDIKYPLLTTSCTHALELAMMTLDVGPADEVIMPSFTFVSTANAAIKQGAKPIFVDIEPVHFNLDPDKLEAAISPKTKAIICVHYGGFGCQMDKIMSTAKKNKPQLYVVEDAAHAIGAKYKGRYLGGIGDIGCFSFHDTKNLVCGEGGAFLSNDSKLAKKAEIMREKGTNRADFLRGEVDKYTWIETGSSYVLSEILAAVLLAQLQKLDTINKERTKLADRYLQALEPLRVSGDLILPQISPEIETNWHIFYIRVHAESARDQLLKHLRRNGIKAAFHFLPLHSSPYAKSRYGYSEEDLPLTEEVSKTLIRLPIYPELASDEQQFVIKKIYEFFGRKES
jgi:dTDP-4-amino-4,6-dideoxygalactose transaminase